MVYWKLIDEVLNATEDMRIGGEMRGRGWTAKQLAPGHVGFLSTHTYYEATQIHSFQPGCSPSFFEKNKNLKLHFGKDF